VLRLCLDRIIPPRRDRPARLRLPTLSTAGDAVTAWLPLLRWWLTARIDPGRGWRAFCPGGHFGKMIEITELDHRVHALEKRLENSHEP